MDLYQHRRLEKQRPTVKLQKRRCALQEGARLRRSQTSLQARARCGITSANHFAASKAKGDTDTMKGSDRVHSIYAQRDGSAHYPVVELTKALRHFFGSKLRE